MSKKTIVVAHIHEYELSDVLENVQEGDGEIDGQTKDEMSDFIETHFTENVAELINDPIYFICEADSPVINTSNYTFDLNEAIAMAGWVE